MNSIPGSLKWQMLLPMAAAFVLCLLVLSWLMLAHLREGARQADEHQLAFTKHIAYELDTQLEVAKAALETVASQLSAYSGQDVSIWLAQGKGVEAAFFDQGLYFFDAKGRRHLHSLDSSLDPDFETALESLSRRWVGLCIRLDEPVISIPIRLHQGQGATRKQGQKTSPAMLLALMVMPIRGEHGEVIGALAGAMDMNRPEFLGSLARTPVGKTGYFFVSAWDGTLLMHPDEQLLMRSDIQPVPVQLLEQASYGVHAVLETRSHDNARVLSSLIKLQSTGWVLGANVPAEDAYAAYYRQVYVFLVVIALGVVMALLGTWLLMRFVIQPLNTFTFALKEFDVGKGVLPEVQFATQTLEILHLLSSFNQLVRRLNQGYREMALANTIFEHAHEGILITDPAQRILKVNAAFCRITGYLPQEVIGQTPRILSSGKHDFAFYRSLWRTIERKGVWQGILEDRRQDGEPFLAQSRISQVVNAEGEVSNYVSVFTDLSEIRQAQDRLEAITSSDVLTGLLSRTVFVERLKTAMALEDEQGGLLALAYVDMDDFKSINDEHGQQLGDALLVEVAGRLRDLVGEKDCLARLGGDEFMLLLVGMDSQEAYLARLMAVLESLSRPYQLDGHRLETGASIGVSFYPADDSDADILIRHASQALYQAKNDGRGRIGCFDVVKSQAIQNRSHVLERIREGLAKNEMLLYYQPKVNLLSGQVVGAEALLRWHHPEQGLLPPAYFLEPFADHEVILEIGDWVIDEALRQMSAWQQAGLVLPVSVNLSARHLVRPGFNQQLQDQLQRYPELWPQWLEIEILESDVLLDITHIQQAIREAQAFGVSFALDDFGTGYSSLAYLKNIPANTLKIDRSFVRDMMIDKDDLAIVQGVIQLANVFQRQVVAEGVETTEHEVALLSLGCTLAQGFGIARPMPAADLPVWIGAYELGKTHPMQVRARCIKAEDFAAKLGVGMASGAK